MRRYPRPDDHFGSGPDGGVDGYGLRCDAYWWGPIIRAWIVSAAGVEIEEIPSFRPRRSFHCQSIPLYASLGRGRVSDLVRPAVVAGLYLPPVFSMEEKFFTVPPRRSSRCQSTRPCADDRGTGTLLCSSAIQLCCWIVSPASIQIAKTNRQTAPDDHFAPSPHRCV